LGIAALFVDGIMSEKLLSLQPALERKKHITIFFILLLACFLGYANSLTNQFMLDDHIVLFGPKGVIHRSFIGLFTDYQVDYYRPFAHIYLWLCSKLFGEGNPQLYHLANLVLFAGIVYLFYLIVFFLTDHRRLACLTALLYALHPINGMLVNYITANVIASSVICLQLSFLFLILSLKKTHFKTYYALSLLLFFTSLFTHELSLIFPGYVFCVAFFIFKKKAKQIFYLVAPYLLLSIAYFIFRLNYFSLPSGVPAGIYIAITKPGIYGAAISDLIFWYFSKLLFPLEILFLWTAKITNQYAMFTIVSNILFFCLTVFFLFYLRKKALKIFSLSVMILGLLPVALVSFHYYPFVNPVIEPHWFYFSSMGFFLFVAAGFDDIRTRFSRKVWLILVIVLLGSYGILLQDNNTKWRNQETYCRYWLRLNDLNLTPYYGLGSALIEKGDYEGGLKILKSGIDKTGIFNALVLTEIGHGEFQRHNFIAAHYAFNQVLKLDPNFPGVHFRLSQMFLKQGRMDEAKMAIQRALVLYPTSKEYRSWQSKLSQMN